MSRTDNVMIDGQNILEEKLDRILDEIEEEIENIIDTQEDRTNSPIAMLWAIEELYQIYGELQTRFWTLENGEILNIHTK